VVRDAKRGLRLLEQEDVDLVITDIQLPGLSGVELTQRIVDRWSDVPVIVMTAYGQIETAVDVLKMGASDYLVKPFGAIAIKESTRVALQKCRIFTEIRHLRRYLKDKCGFGGMLSKTPEMHRVFETIRRVAPTDSTVVIEGETGTGKELVASAIHQQSARRNGPLVTINCSGVPETLLESELFGYERGAFTGAVQARPGKIELAHGGTLFLDEIETMPISMQSRLLLTLNSQLVQRLGSSLWNRVDMRVIAATNVPLKELVAAGQMRSDIYYRLNVISIQLVPLRQRLQDIPLLVQDFLRHHPISIQKNITSASPEAMDCLMRHNWPGNIRELQNVLEKAIVLARSRMIEEVEVSDPFTEENDRGAQVPGEYSLEEWVQAQEREYLVAKLQAHGGRIDLTARSCGVDVRTLHRKMRIYGLDRKVFHLKTPETIAE
jgi:DNA-binding NtrC family response regulator